MNFQTYLRVARRIGSVATFVLVCSATWIFAEQGDDMLSAGITQHESSSYDAAISTLERFIATYPNSANRNKAELYLAHAYLNRNSFENVTDAGMAQTHFNYILNQGANAQYYLEAFFHSAYSAYRLQYYEQARDVFTQFLQQYPQDELAQYAICYLADSLARVGTPQQAIQTYDLAIANYPNSPLIWQCKISRAELLGKSGQYAQADQELQKVATELSAIANPPVDDVGEVAIQRARLLLVQQNFDGAIQILDAFIQQYQNDPNAKAPLQKAYLFETYAYFGKRDFQRSLLCIDALERLGDLPPEAALCKIKLQLLMKNPNGATTLLNQLQASDYGQAKPDVIESCAGLVSLASGNWNDAIDRLTRLLQITPTSASTVGINYVNEENRNQLSPLAIIESCGVLTLAYAKRYASTKNAQDSAMQNAIFQATSAYANTVSDPAAPLMIASIDKRRQAALTQPTATLDDAYSVMTPNALGGTNYGVGYNNMLNFTDPTKTNGAQTFMPTNQNGVGTGYAGYIPLPNVNQNNASNNANGVNGQQTNANAYPAGLMPNAANQQFAPNGQPFNPYQPNVQNVQNPNGIPQNQQQVANQQPNQQQVDANGQPIATTSTDPNTTNTNNANNADGTTSNEGPVEKLTPKDAQTALRRATTYYVNREYDRANELLLETITSSETFWQDCPQEAAKIMLLRAKTLIELGKGSEAQMTCQDLLNNAPYSNEATVAAAYLGFNYDRNGRPNEAVKYLRLATADRNSPYADVALYYLGMNERERGNVTDAANAFARIYRDFPDSPYWSHAVWYLATIEKENGRRMEAEKLVNEALSKRPDAAIVDHLLFLKGELALIARDYDKALIAFDMIVEQYPDSIYYAKSKNRLAAVPARFREFSEEEEEDVSATEIVSQPEPQPTPQVQPREQVPARSSAERAQVDPRIYERARRSDDLENFRPAPPRRLDSYEDELQLPRQSSSAKSTTPSRSSTKSTTGTTSGTTTKKSTAPSSTSTKSTSTSNKTPISSSRSTK